MSRSVLHLSDVHFGSDHARTRARTLSGLVASLRPDVVVVSGDLTQRARTAEFAEAREFLDMIDVPQIVVPGNHDVPLWNVARRFISPLEKWHRFIGSEALPSFVDDELAIVGIDTTRRFGVKGGRVDSSELREAARRLHRAAEGACRMVVGHHPLELPGPGGLGSKALGGGRALHALARLGVEVVLSGHMHESHSFRPVDRVSGAEGPILLVNAGTATSHRGRRREEHANSFNVITIRASEIGVTTYVHTRAGVTYVAGEPAWFPRVRTARRRAGRSKRMEATPESAPVPQGAPDVGSLPPVG